MNRACVIYSGGMDSTTLLYLAKRDNEEVIAITFDYGSKHAKQEIASAKEICKDLNIPHRILPINLHGDSSLFQDGEEIPEGYYTDENMSKTVVPFRNGVMISIAAGFAEANGCQVLYIGAHAGDHAVYPDCRAGFIRAMTEAIDLGTNGKVYLKAPFVSMMKGEIAEIGKDLGVPYEKTWSCYKGTDRPCLKCGTCTERTEAFIEAGMPDPLLQPEEWMKAMEELNLAQRQIGQAILSK